MMITLVLAAAAAAITPSAADAHLIGEIVATAAQHDGIEVVSQADVKRAINLDAARQLAGHCEESCMAEVAAAMGARMVLDVTVGSLANDVVAVVNLYDTAAAKGRRRMVRADSVPDLVPLTEKTVREAIADAVRGKPAGETWKVLVLDVKLNVGDAAAGGRPQAGTAPSFLGITGGVAMGAGVLAAGVGGVLDFTSVSAAAEAGQRTTAASLAVKRQHDSDAFATGALACYVAGGVLLVGGAGLVVVALAGGE